MQGAPPGNGRQERDLVAIVQNCVALCVLFIYGDVKGAGAQIGNTAVQQVTDGRRLRQGDNIVLEARRLSQTCEKSQTYVHATTVPSHQTEISRCQSPDFPPRLRSRRISPMLIDFSSAFAMS